MDVHKSILSIQHKLNIAMYQAALICQLKPEDFKSFEGYRDAAKRVEHLSKIDYKICSYTMGDSDEYLLILSFLIETLASTVFSLLDVCGSLINQLYMLNIKEKEVSFYVAMQQIQKQGTIDTNDVVYRLLYSYYSTPDQTDYASKALKEITWVKPMKEIRNRTTHRPITDVCDFDERRDIYAGIHQEPSRPEFFINDTIIYPNKKLCNFAKEVFDGVEEFVEDFYASLEEAVQRSDHLPIY